MEVLRPVYPSVHWKNHPPRTSHFHPLPLPVPHPIAHHYLNCLIVFHQAPIDPKRDCGLARCGRLLRLMGSSWLLGLTRKTHDVSVSKVGSIR